MDTNQVLSIIDQVAKAEGVPPVLAEADAIQESGLDPYAVGQGSYGLYQLQEGGELNNLPGNLNQRIAEAFNPTMNADQALGYMGQIERQYGSTMSPGMIAATAQRPEYPSQYAADVNALVAQIQNGYVPPNVNYSPPPGFPAPAPGGQVTGSGSTKPALGLGKTITLSTVKCNWWEFWTCPEAGLERIALVIGGFLLVAVGLLILFLGGHQTVQLIRSAASKGAEGAAVAAVA